MLVLLKIAITGGLACGKSSVCRLFRKFGAYVASADEIVHQLLSPKSTIGKKVIALLGNEIVKNATFDRRKIAQKIFQNRNLLDSFESILHPAVYEDIQRQYESVSSEGKAPFFVAEIPLLFETGYEEEFDRIIAVIADKDLCKQRYRVATGVEDDDFEKRSSRQLSVEDKAARADVVIINNGNIVELEHQVRQIFDQLKAEA